MAPAAYVHTCTWYMHLNERAEFTTFREFHLNWSVASDPCNLLYLSARRGKTRRDFGCSVTERFKDACATSGNEHKEGKRLLCEHHCMHREIYVIGLLRKCWSLRKLAKIKVTSFCDASERRNKFLLLYYLNYAISLSSFFLGTVVLW